MTALTHDLGTTDRPATLSLRLREGTRPEHERAETSGFVEQLMSGGLDLAAYADLAAQQWAVYRALEDASAAIRTDPQGATLVFDELTRTPEIEKDLTFLVGADWAERVTIHPATERYVARLHEVGDSLPAYAAHAYTRYLGDLSGGQIVKRMLERHYGLSGDGLAFYTFVEIPKSKPFKDVYRERLDALELSPAQVEATVEEAKHAFRLNSAMFADLGAVHC
ncbi:heme oxygenase (biliverdin-producing) [Cellulosimicrobium sp. CUA-896]|uniref:biliverdin-producing heme oxygenase n=1 Tax=Cellulosimicrobium sp. CUA-896 TaxID=1517881 RepID=UPI00095EC098|nr:biliverdin-producing heme oxygenase [Cellulosimicrobium sp. CUA-896]OLT52089.1 heme oxygenase [Cellulosimicrobium sp. CUA-896]